MDLNEYFEPIDINKIDIPRSSLMPCIADRTISFNSRDNNFPNYSQASLIMLGVNDDRGSEVNKGCVGGADEIRCYLYPLALPTPDNMRLVDLGNLSIGLTVDDTRQALTDVVAQLLRDNHIVIVIGGSQDLTFSLYQAYAKVGKVINICAVDSRFDLDESPQLHSRNYLRHIIMQQPNYLFNFTNIGYQTYFVGQSAVELFEELQFDAFRLGWLQENLMRAEPLMRNADCVSIDISAVRQSDAPANADPSPHGLYGEQLCRLARFAGMSDKTSTFGLFEFNPSYDNHGQTAHMLAHALWYFIEGVHNRKQDFPYKDTENYRKVTVPVIDHNQSEDIVFFKSKKSDRWWIQVPCTDDQLSRFKQHLLVPCLVDDYVEATQNRIPEIWLKYKQRING